MACQKSMYEISRTRDKDKRVAERVRVRRHAKRLHVNETRCYSAINVLRKSVKIGLVSFMVKGVTSVF